MGGFLPIARYLAKQFGMAGEDDMAVLILDGAADAIEDIMLKTMETMMETDVEKKSVLAKDQAENVFPRVLGGLEKLAAANNSAKGWFYGPKVSYADIYFCHFVSYVLEVAPDVLDKFPALRKLLKSVLTLPNIAKWMKERPNNKA